MLRPAPGVEVKLIAGRVGDTVGPIVQPATDPLYLDVTPETGLQRARSRGALDRIEQESMNFFNRTRARYLELAAADPSIRTVDATQPLDAVARDIRATIAQWMAEQAA